MVVLTMRSGAHLLCIFVTMVLICCIGCLLCGCFQGWGRIVNTGSMHALVASPYKSAYNAAKHGIAGFTKTVALEMAQKNITCNAICPGYVLTGMLQNCTDRSVLRHDCWNHLLYQQKVTSLTQKTVTLEMAQKNITCNAICPGYVLTGMLQNCTICSVLGHYCWNHLL
jgi:NAD(P)-dependent dehydrogenase (short-subunit alcohol dehydrogenase family)